MLAQFGVAASSVSRTAGAYLFNHLAILPAELAGKQFEQAPFPSFPRHAAAEAFGMILGWEAAEILPPPNDALLGRLELSEVSAVGPHVCSHPHTPLLILLGDCLKREHLKKGTRPPNLETYCKQIAHQS